MTARAACTQGQIQRAIRAAMNAGLQVTGIAPDGTVLIKGDDVPRVAPEEPGEAAQWSDDDQAEE